MMLKSAFKWSLMLLVQGEIQWILYKPVHALTECPSADQYCTSQFKCIGGYYAPTCNASYYSVCIVSIGRLSRGRGLYQLWGDDSCRANEPQAESSSPRKYHSKYRSFSLGRSSFWLVIRVAPDKFSSSGGTFSAHTRCCLQDWWLLAIN